jgi:hypothetical protein
MRGLINRRYFFGGIPPVRHLNSLMLSIDGVEALSGCRFSLMTLTGSALMPFIS